MLKNFIHYIVGAAVLNYADLDFKVQILKGAISAGMNLRGMPPMVHGLLKISEEGTDTYSILNLNSSSIMYFYKSTITDFTFLMKANNEYLHKPVIINSELYFEKSTYSTEDYSTEDIKDLIFSLSTMHKINILNEIYIIFMIHKAFSTEISCLGMNWTGMFRLHLVSTKMKETYNVGL